MALQSYEQHLMGRIFLPSARTKADEGWII